MQDQGRMLSRKEQGAGLTEELSMGGAQNTGRRRVMTPLWLRSPECVCVGGGCLPARASTIEALPKEERTAGGRWCAEGLGRAVEAE